MSSIGICTENEDNNKVDANVFISLLDLNFLCMVGSISREKKFVVCDETKAAYVSISLFAMYTYS